MNSYVLLCKNTCGAGQGGHTARRIYSLSLVTLWVFCRLVQEGDILCVPTFGNAEFIELNADKFLR